ncbi:unnamed protein product [Eruca vesicaria subsp. sativa]|uniref:Uncharacterized protein n=1 Tax=Eruca vesicaria subsp. sativa TaxID=29727 RepID=A0ABC8M8S1_ERUVS|nr:unnamed protein product [Eruca vesicaria subsp. sativa]
MSIFFSDDIAGSQKHNESWLINWAGALLIVQQKSFEGDLVHLQPKEPAQNQDVAVMVNVSEVTKAETLTILEIFAFLKQEPAQIRLLQGMSSEETLSSDKGVVAEIVQLIMGKGLIPVCLDAWKLGRRAKS